jgi:hypothetical protein
MSKLISTILVVGFPIVIFIISYIVTPSYYGPMFKDPIGIAMLVGGFIWLIIGAFVLMITNGFLRRFLCVMFITPVILITMLGPAVITIASALGPVVESEGEANPAATIDNASAVKAVPENSTTGGAKKPKGED